MQYPYFPQDPFEMGFMIVFGLAFLVQMIYLWGIFSKLAFYKSKTEKLQVTEAVSVVICARNEYTNLSKNLPIILAQDYPDFEVVVVNDNSQDDSLELLEDMARKDPKLKIVNLSQDLNFFRGKKFPLSIGIKSAVNDILLLTDADCRPASDQWIDCMARNFQDGKEIVLGYGGYERKNSFLNYLIRYETLWVAIQYLSFSLAKRTYMGVGRNMAYRKTLFYKNKGFSAHYTIPSGDDDLFINSVATKKNVAIEVDHGSTTISEPKHSIGNWIRQKRRHLTTWKYYRSKYKRWLGAWSMSKMLLLILFVLLLLLKYNIFITAGIFLLYFISQLIIMKKCMNQLNEKELLLISPLAEIFLFIFYPMLSIVNMISKPDKWK